MRRYFRHILLSLISVICTVSCIEELDDPNPVHVSDTPTVLVPRVKSFTNQYITKAGYTTDETQISSLTVLVFNNNGQLVHIQQPSNLSSIELNKSMLDAPGQDVTAATIVMIANVGLDKITDGNGKTFQEIKDNKFDLTLEGMENCTFDFSANPVITSISDNFTGFPMIGGVKNVNLSATKESQNAISVPLKILYAKINFYISVDNGTENTGTGMQFTLNGYSVHNVAKKTGMAIPTEKGEPVSDFLGEIMNEDDKAENDGATDSLDYTESGVTGSKTGTTNVSGPQITFTFYIAESRYNHNSDLKGIYPSDDWLTTDDTEDGQVKNGVKSFYDDLIQQYKPKLANVSTGEPAAGLASYVLLNGTYVDYRGTSWNVNYTVYLGKDNAQNFHVDRNSEYTNYITIKGIRNNDSYIDRDDEGNITSDQHVWIDHRVNVTTDDIAKHVRITRETLIDSHIEVRPLRVNWPDKAYDGVRVYLPTNSDGSLVSWIGIERFTGPDGATCRDGALYCYKNGIPTGKRKYFTDTLISELQTMGGEYGVRTDEDNKKYIYLLNGETAWIYFDEYTDISDNADDVRNAEIYLEFIIDDKKSVNDVYVVKQCRPQARGGCYIESYEEYLHTYDSADKYHLSTSPVDYTQQGLAWGLVNTPISDSLIVTNASTPASSLRYDYYHKSDDTSYSSFYQSGTLSWTKSDLSNETGLRFTERASRKENLTIEDMGTIPTTAYEYCLSKNKFKEDPDGQHSLDIHWYLPDVYEMQAVLNHNSEGSYVDFNDESYYWSSQPSSRPEASIVNTYLQEITDSARAVSLTRIGNLARASQNRIRCFYSADGIRNVDMSQRVPDGIGGNFTFYMQAYRNKQKSSPAYFQYLLPKTPNVTIDDSKTSQYTYNDDRTNYPTKSNSDLNTEFVYKQLVDKSGKIVEGFVRNPRLRDEWNPVSTITGGDGYFTTLSTYPGLSEYVLDKHWIYNYYKESATLKKGEQIIHKGSSIEMSKDLPSAADLKTLDHTAGGTMLNINFDSNTNTQYHPVFKYEEHVSDSVITNYKLWSPPDYTPTNHDLVPDEVSLSEKGYGDKTGTSTGTSTYQQADTSSAKRAAFNDDWLGNKGAYTKAKEDAKANLDVLLSPYLDDGYTISGDVNYTELKWDSESTNIKWIIKGDYGSTIFGNKYLKKVEAKCNVTVTASVILTKAASITLYLQSSGTGCWVDQPSRKEGTSTPVIKTDQLNMYCGNSFTIQLSTDYIQAGYRISKVKVYYLDNNLVKSGIMGDGIFNQRQTDVYARFIDSVIYSDDNIPKEKEIPAIGSTETLQLPGMDYSRDGESGWQQWTGSDRTSVTLVLVDYAKVNNVITNIYRYKTADTDLTKSIIIDKIEVKCTKQ